MRKLIADLGVRLRGISLMVDTVDSCTFTCPSCPVGNAPRKRGGAQMQIHVFREILDRLQSQVKVRNVLLYSFSEPLSNRDLPGFVDECYSRKIPTLVSTNLSVNIGNVHSCMILGLNELRISFSGFKHGEYFHRGRRMEKFIENCAKVSAWAQEYNTKVSLIWHIYKTNADERVRVENFAAQMGFNLIYEKAFFIPYETITRDAYTEEDRKLLAHLIDQPGTGTTRSDYCYYQRKQLVLDTRGRVYLCRHVYDDEFIVGDVFKDSVWDILKAMKSHKYCRTECKPMGLNAGYTP